MRAEGADALLLERARAGDTEAYVALFGRHHPEALATATDLAGPEAADDVIAEAFVRILACLDEGGGPRQSFAPYLDLTLHRAAVEHLRRDVGEEAAVAVPEVSVLQPTDPRAARTTQLETFSQLTPRAQMALWLRDVEEVPTDEVGELLGLDALVADQLARRARAAFSAAHPGPLVPALLALHEPVAPTPADTLSLVPPLEPIASAPAAHAGGSVGAARWRRWAPGIAAAAIVAIVGTFAVNTLGRGPVDETSQQEAALAPPVVGQAQSFRDFDLHGGRIAPAVLGGLVDADADRDAEEATTPLNATSEGDPKTTPGEVEGADERAGDSQMPPEQGSETTPKHNDDPDDANDGSDEHTPTADPQPDVAVSSAGVEKTETKGGAVARFAVDHLASGAQITITLTGEEAEIRSVSGGGDCSIQGRTATCNVAGGDATGLAVTVKAPNGGTVSVRVTRNDGSSASASADLPTPIEETVEDTPPTTPPMTPTGGPGDPSPDEPAPDDLDTAV